MLTVWLLALGASCGWAGFDLGRKVLAARLKTLPLATLVVLGEVPIFLVWALLQPRLAIAPGYLAPAAVSVVLNVAANLLFIRAVQIAPLGLTIPFLAFTPVFTGVTALVLLAELPTSMQALGIAGVVAGGLVLATAGGDGAQSWWHAVRRSRGSLLMLVVAALWSVTGPVDKVALQYASVPVHSLVLTSGVALGLLLLVVLGRRTAELGTALREWRLLGLSVLAAGLGLALQLTAIRELYVSFMEALKRTVGMSAALVNGRIVFAEPVTPRKLVAVALMAVGVVLILTPA
ncbi:MAG: DMT family transporter [Myxococcota bacterium]